MSSIHSPRPRQARAPTSKRLQTGQGLRRTCKNANMSDTMVPGFLSFQKGALHPHPVQFELRHLVESRLTDFFNRLV